MMTEEQIITIKKAAIATDPRKAMGDSIACWNRQHHGSWHLHGHSHGNYKIPEGKILDVGLDSAYNIYGKHCFFDEAMIEEYMKTRSLHAPDGHTVRAKEQ